MVQNLNARRKQGLESGFLSLSFSGMALTGEKIIHRSTLTEKVRSNNKNKQKIYVKPHLAKLFLHLKQVLLILSENSDRSGLSNEQRNCT